MKKQILSMLTGLLIGTTFFAPQLTQAAGMVAEPTWQPIYVDGKQVAMEAYNIAGHNYVKLRDIGFYCTTEFYSCFHILFYFIDIVS